MLKKNTNSMKNHHNYHSLKSSSEIHGYQSIESSKPRESNLKVLNISKCLEGILSKTEDNREVLFKDSSDCISNTRSVSKPSIREKKRNQAYETPKNSLKMKNKLLSPKRKNNEQDEIINVQQLLIEDLKKEIKLLSKKPIHRESESISSNDSSLRTENFKLNKKIEQIGRAYDIELINIKNGILRKDEIFHEYKAGLKMKLEKKKLKIELLKKKINGMKQEYSEFYDKACKNAFEELKTMLEKETISKIKIEEELFKVKESEQTLKEENSILIQNYEEIQKKCIDLENKTKNINDLINSYSNKEEKIEKIDDYLSNLHKMNEQHNTLKNKYQLLLTKNSELEKENKNLKQQINRIKIFYEEPQENPHKAKQSPDIEKFSRKLIKKKNIIQELKKKVSILEEKLSKCYQSKKNNSKDDSELYQIDSQSIYEEELNLLKTENKILLNKEQELNLKLKNSEKARYYYQEQTIALKEKVNSLEMYIKNIENSLNDDKNHDEPDVYSKKKLHRTNTAQEIRQLLKDYRHNY